MSQVLPHIRIPISTGDDDKPQATIQAMADTGAGLNLGKRSYHKSIHEGYPGLVLQYAALADLENSNLGLNGLSTTSVMQIVC